MNRARDDFLVGLIVPSDAEYRQTYQRPLNLLPPNVRITTSSLELSDYTARGVAVAIDRFWNCVETLARAGARRIVLAGVPICARLGRAHIQALLAEVSERYEVSASSSTEDIVAALARLGATSVALASRWHDEVNRIVVDYFAAAGIETVYSTAADQWAAEAKSMSFEEGIRMALGLTAEAARHAPEAEALILPGGSWRPLGVVPYLEATLGRPVVTNESARMWTILRTLRGEAIEGWGILLSTP